MHWCGALRTRQRTAPPFTKLGRHSTSNPTTRGCAASSCAHAASTAAASPAYSTALPANGSGRSAQLLPRAASLTCQAGALGPAAAAPPLPLPGPACRGHCCCGCCWGGHCCCGCCPGSCCCQRGCILLLPPLPLSLPPPLPPPSQRWPARASHVLARFAGCSGAMDAGSLRRPPGPPEPVKGAGCSQLPCTCCCFCCVVAGAGPWCCLCCRGALALLLAAGACAAAGCGCMCWSTCPAGCCCSGAAAGPVCLLPAGAQAVACVFGAISRCRLSTARTAWPSTCAGRPQLAARARTRTCMALHAGEEGIKLLKLICCHQLHTEHLGVPSAAPTGAVCTRRAWCAFAPRGLLCGGGGGGPAAVRLGGCCTHGPNQLRGRTQAAVRHMACTLEQLAIFRLCESLRMCRVNTSQARSYKLQVHHTNPSGHVGASWLASWPKTLDSPH
jgi:hypothetical protein